MKNTVRSNRKYSSTSKWRQEIRKCDLFSSRCAIKPEIVLQIWFIWGSFALNVTLLHFFKAINLNFRLFGIPKDTSFLINYIKSVRLFCLLMNRFRQGYFFWLKYVPFWTISSSHRYRLYFRRNIFTEWIFNESCELLNEKLCTH